MNFRTALILFSFVFLFPTPSMAEPEPVQTIGDENTRIEVDTENNLIRFIVDGKQYAVMDEEGMHVNGFIALTGATVSQAPEKYPAYPGTKAE